MGDEGDDAEPPTPSPDEEAQAEGARADLPQVGGTDDCSELKAMDDFIQGGFEEILSHPQAFMTTVAESLSRFSNSRWEQHSLTQNILLRVIKRGFLTDMGVKAAGQAIVNHFGRALPKAINQNLVGLDLD